MFLPIIEHKGGLFDAIGLGEFPLNEYKQILGDGWQQSMKIPTGKRLGKEAAEQLGLAEATPVGTAFIDAYVVS
jgi:ribulose kinase